MTIKYREKFITELFEDIAALITGGANAAPGAAQSIESRLCELALANSASVADYWRRTRPGFGIPDTAFKGATPYFFADADPVRTFRTSGTSGTARGTAHYSARGMELMGLSILANARRHIVRDLNTPVILRLVPSEEAAPEMVMAHGMQLIANHFGLPQLSACVVGRNGVDFALLQQRIEAAIADQVPVILIGGSFAFVNICDALETEGKRWQLPSGSRVVDAGGFKGRSRTVGVDALHAAINRTFGVPAADCINLFGMTELASQLYDAATCAVGPLGERPKARQATARPQVRDAQTLELRERGAGLLEIVDLCILDRPFAVLTGDRGIACAEGVAIAGRIERGQSRGCSLTLDALTKGDAHA